MAGPAEPIPPVLRPSAAPSGTAPLDVVAVAASVLWLVLCGLFLGLVDLTDPEGFDAVRFVTVLVAVFIPVALVWVAAHGLRSSRRLAAEVTELRAGIDALRQAQIAQQQAGTARLTQAAAPPSRQARAAPPPEPVQGSLPLPAPLEAGLPAPVTVLRALDFPRDETDAAGFDALREALRSAPLAPLVRAAEDVLTLLSQDGIYVDDLPPDRPRPELWRDFAEGTRGRQVAPLGGIRDEAALARVRERMRRDAVFRDAAHHFLRRFDRLLATLVAAFDDTALGALAETRTGRAFMLLARAAGTFD